MNIPGLGSTFHLKEKGVFKNTIYQTDGPNNSLLCFVHIL